MLRPKQLSYPVFLSTDEMLHKYGLFEARQGRMYSTIVSYYECALLRTKGTDSMKEINVKRLLSTLDTIKANSISNRLCRFWLNNARDATVKQIRGVEISGKIDKSQAARIWRQSNFRQCFFPTM